MPFRLTLAPDEKVIVLEFQDLVTAADLRGALRDFLAVTERTGWRNVLGDCRTQRTRYSALDLSEIWTVFGSDLSFRGGLREALILPGSPVDVDGPLLWVELCRARGLEIRAFEEVEEGWRWLLSEAAER